MQDFNDWKEDFITENCTWCEQFGWCCGNDSECIEETYKHETLKSKKNVDKD